MPVLPNARHERFAQGLASGMGVSEAYAAAGYKPSRSSASELRAKPDISERVSELLGKGAEQVEETLTLRQRLAMALYEKALQSLPGLAVETAPEVKAIGELALSIDKDERLMAGGSNPDQPSITINVVSVEVEEVFRRVRPMIEQESKDGGEHEEDR